MANNYIFGTGHGLAKIECIDGAVDPNQWTGAWYMSIRIYMEAYPTDQPIQPICMAGYSESNFNFLLTIMASGAIRGSARNSGGVQHYTSSVTVPLNSWATIGVGWDGTELYVDLDGGSKEVLDAAFAYAPNDSSWSYRLYEDAYTDVVRMKDWRVEQNAQAQIITWALNEGSGSTCTSVTVAGTGTWNGTITDLNTHEVDGPADGPATSTTFGPVATNDDASVTRWQWEESADGNTWADVGTILTDVSGADETTLTVNSAPTIADQTQVRCRAISVAVPAGVVSHTATLTVVSE